MRCKRCGTCLGPGVERWYEGRRKIKFQCVECGWADILPWPYKEYDYEPSIR